MCFPMHLTYNFVNGCDEFCLFAETISKFGSGLFLLVQVVLLLDFVHGWNDKWVGFDEQFWSVLGFAILIYFCNIFLITLYYICFNDISVFNCFFVETGMLLYLLFHLFVILSHLYFREFSFTSSHHLDKTAESMSFLLL